MPTHTSATSSGPFLKANLPMTNPNPGSSRKLPYPSIPGIYKNHTWLQDLAKGGYKGLQGKKSGSSQSHP
eukprot:1012883-Pelagomonas_calceolata.AAC.1